MLTLILMRHAKSSWSDPLCEDHDRALNARGRVSAIALGMWLHDQGFKPDMVISSSARRTLETYHCMGVGTPAKITETLYLADKAKILGNLRQAQGDTVLVLGHNPGIADCADALLTKPHMHPDFRRFPTGATLVAQFQAQSWMGITWGSGHALDFVIPRELVPNAKQNHPLT